MRLRLDPNREKPSRGGRRLEVDPRYKDLKIVTAQVVAIIIFTSCSASADGQAHIGRGQRHLGDGRPELALVDFERAITYPDNLGVGRSDKPQHANAHYGRGRSLHALGRLEQAREVWRKGANGSAGSEQQSKHRQLCSDALAEHE